jgi:hypothetical protein
MRLSKEALGTSVVVRRVWTGATPFRWEVCRGDAGAPVYVSSDRFRSMHDAYLAGQARLPEFLPKRSMPPGVTKNREWQSSQIGPGVGAARA